MKNFLRYLAFILMVGGACAQTSVWSTVFGRNNSLTPNNSWDTSLLCMTATYANEPNRQIAKDIVNGRGERCPDLVPTTQSNAQQKQTEVSPNSSWSKTTLCMAVSYSDEENAVLALEVLKIKNENCNDVLIGSAKERYFSLSASYKDRINKRLPQCQGKETHLWNDCFGFATFSSGNKYFGEWRNGGFNGFGTYIFSNGTKYVGSWKDAKYNGEGTLTSAFGSIINQGFFRDGNLIQDSQLQSLPKSSTDNDIEKLRAEAEEAKKKQIELEAQLKLAQQPVTQQSSPSPIITATRSSAAWAKQVACASIVKAASKKQKNLFRYPLTIFRF